jgi:hypothetical protein
MKDYAIPGRILHVRNHTNVYADEKTQYDLRDMDEKFRDPETGKLSAQALKHWRLLDQKLEYLAKDYGIFASGNLCTDCPIHRYFGMTPRLHHPSHFQNKFRAYILYIETVGLTCDSRTCEWKDCPLHYSKFPTKKERG